MHSWSYLSSILVILASYLALRTSITSSLARFRTSFATLAPPSMTTRTIVKSVHALEQDEGVGARVRRSIGGMSLRHADPFVMLDHFTASKGAGFPSHPHRGQATLTRVISGAIDHADSTGREGRLFAGDVQYMEAGRGVAHSEMPVTEEGVANCEGMQLWLDLPTALKKAPATYQDMTSADLPNAHPSEGVEITVVSGKAQGSAAEGLLRSPLKTSVGCEYYDVKFTKAGASVFQTLTPDWTSFVYVLRGQVKIGGKLCSQHYTQVLSAETDQTGISLEAVSDEVRLIVVAGQPLSQPIFQHGPFVVQSRQEAIEAIRDFQAGRNGFEGAAAWLAARS